MKNGGSLVDRIRQVLNDGLVEPGEHLLIALSGGRDSVALVSLLRCLSESMGFSLSAAHYHHGLRPEADHELDFVLGFCAAQQIPLAWEKGDVLAQLGGQSVEEAARAERYAFLERKRVALGATKIVVAHHRGDLAETVLMNLLRGAGTRGLRGMEAQRGCIIRPLLSVSREEINAYVNEQKLPYMEDTSNADMRYTRNRIRLDLLPHLMRHYNPAIEKALVQTAQAAAEDERYLSQAAEQAYEKALYAHHPGYSVVLRESVTELPVPIRKRVYRRALEALDRWTLDRETLLLLEEGVQDNRRTDIGTGMFCDRKGGYVQIYRPFSTQESCVLSEGMGKLSCLSAEVQTDLLLAAGLPWKSPWDFRTRKPGDMIYYGGKMRSFSDVLKGKNIPRCLRDSLGVIAADNRILAVQHFWEAPLWTEQENGKKGRFLFTGGVFLRK